MKEEEICVETHPVDEELEPLSDGSVQGWLTVLGSALVYFASFGFTNSFGFFQDYYQTHYLPDTPPSTIAFIGTLQTSLMYVVGPIAGALFDAYGLRGVLFGLVVAFNTQPALAVVGQHFKQRRALAMGLVAGGSSISGSFLPIVLSYLVPKIGFGWSLRVVALMMLCCYLISMAVSRTKEPPKAPTAKAVVNSLLDFKGYKDPRYLMLAIGNFVATLGLYIPYYYIGNFYLGSFSLQQLMGTGSYALLRHPSASIHQYLLPLINGSGFFGRVLGGYFADKTGRLNLLCPMTFLSGVFCLSMWLPDRSGGVATILAFVCLYGFTSGIFISVTPPAVAQISPDDKIGARIGAFFMLTAVATLLGSPIAGMLIDESSQDGYSKMIIFSGATLIIGSGLMYVGRILCDRDIRKKW
ncbi:putative monocarboxylate permease protein [Neofusicoccum parvum UCRNP2]|uniref:Putative monocarboxylate permease protein n=1 Tax=Botryosphaeria parva (strain UCR-NP2) TaxID=1287680 RepID=R1EY26_BOTPV|nr:putative monocarboxylate permease protein [Neofusicoccum parvum UCRNP2]